MNSKSSLTYADAGVDIDAGDRLVDAIKPFARRTMRPEVLAGIGGFGALFALPAGFKEPVLVSGTDGVGTKLKLAFALDRHDTVGIDLVAMSVNDVLVQGAEPLYFLDYFACGKLKVETATAVVQGIARGCELAGCALIGGETAEMPGMYAEGEYDLAGFAVGIVEKAQIIDGQNIAPGDVILGLASSGAHSNGYSLIRKVFERSGMSFDQPFDGATLGEKLIAPTRIYVKSILALHRAVPVKGLAHITGGGIVENVPRVLPMGVRAEIEASAWRQPALFDWIAEHGGVAQSEMYRTFNCGIGMVVIVAADDATRAAGILRAEGETVFEIGRIGAAVADGPRCMVT